MAPDPLAAFPGPALVPRSRGRGRISGEEARRRLEVSRVVRELASPGHTLLRFLLAGQPIVKGLGEQGRWLLCVPWVSARQRRRVARRLPFISVSAVTRNTVRRLQLAYSGTCVAAAAGSLRGGAGCSSTASSVDSTPAAQASASANRFSLSFPSVPR